MIYLYIGENPTDRTEINTISYVVPENLNLYKTIEEKDLPIEKEGHYRQLYYNKTEDVVTAEYTPIPPTEEELLREELEKTKKELEKTQQGIAQTTLELTNMIAMSGLA